MSTRRLFGSASPLLLLSLIALALVGCPAELPPPALPTAEMPQVEMPRQSSPPKSARVVFDTPGEPALVKEVVGQTHYTDNDGHDNLIDVVQGICVTPCVHDFTIGTRTLKLYSQAVPGHWSRFDLDVSQPIVVRHVLEQHASPAGFILGSLAGAFALGTGVTGLSLLVDATASDRRGTFIKDQSEFDVGLPCAIGGAALGIASGVAFIALRGKHRVPATTIFPLPANVSYSTGAPSPLTFRF